MKTRLFLSGLIAAGSLAFIGCGGGSSGGDNEAVASSSSSLSSTAASSSSTTSSTSSVSSTGSSSSAASGSAPKTVSAAQALVVGGFMEAMVNAVNSGSVTQASARSGARYDVSPYVCPDGGSASYSGSTLSYSQCKNEGTTMNGSMTTDGSGNTQFSGFSIDDGATYTYINASLSTSGTPSSTSYDVTVGGTFEFSENGETVRLVFTNYHATRSGNQFTVNGTVSIQNDPDTCDANGDYVVQTIDPLTVDGSGNVTGTIKVNNDTIVYNGDGTATVNGQKVSLDDLETCNA